MKRTFIIFQLVLFITLTSCRSTKPLASKSEPLKKPEPSSHVSRTENNSSKSEVTAPTVRPGTPEARYLEKYSAIAVIEMKRTGVPASITLAQGMLESDYGRSRLASVGNNHFGIKCHNGWKGETIYHNDDKRNDCFRQYSDAEESFRDHSDFIKNGSRYSFLFSLSPYDYKSWAHGLKQAGYATNPQYAFLIIKKIEENHLEIFDRGYTASSEVTRKDPPKVRIETTSENETIAQSSSNTNVIVRAPRVRENNRVQYIIVKDGDTIEKIEKEFKLLKWEIVKYNELPENFKLTPGQILYLQPKREKAEPGKEFYTTMEGDTMYSISQKFGVKVKSIYEMNRLEKGAEPKPGSKLWLRSMKPVS